MDSAPTRCRDSGGNAGFGGIQLQRSGERTLPFFLERILRLVSGGEQSESASRKRCGARQQYTGRDRLRLRARASLVASVPALHYRRVVARARIQRELA